MGIRSIRSIHILFTGDTFAGKVTFPWLGVECENKVHITGEGAGTNRYYTQTHPHTHNLDMGNSKGIDDTKLKFSI